MVNYVVAHDPKWAAAFETEAEAVQSALPGVPLVLHHIGSTSIPDILAKPIIDMMGVATRFDALDAQAGNLEALGYENMGAFGIEDRRYFRKCDAHGTRTHHLHVFLEGSRHIDRHLAFRDYLRVHPQEAAAYSALKQSLMADGPLSWDAYLDGKDAFIKEAEAKALAWFHN